MNFSALDLFLAAVSGAFLASALFLTSEPAAAPEDPALACAEAHSEYIARSRSNGQCLQTPGCWIMADDIHRMNQAQADAAAACPISVMTK